MGIAHAKVSAKSDGGDSTLVLPSDWNATHTVDVLAPSGLTGATTATRYVGGTASIAPTTGTFSTGDFVITQAGAIYICTAGGSPGTWAAASGSVPAVVGAAGRTTAYSLFR